MDIDGASRISQVFASMPGQRYQVSLFCSRNPLFTSVPRTGFVTVTGNSTLVSKNLVHDVPNSATHMNWQEFSTTFVADSAATTLTIQGDAPNGAEGFAVDNVNISIVAVVTCKTANGEALLSEILAIYCPGFVFSSSLIKLEGKAA